jgi:peroxiredoxin
VYQRIGLDAIHIARVATFVVDATGVVRYAHIGANQLDRAPVQDVLNAVGNLGKL